MSNIFSGFFLALDNIMCKIWEILKTKNMKIWIDARICDEGWYYSEFICELVDAFVKQNSEHDIVVYKKNNCKFNRFSLFDDIKAKKLFDAEGFVLMIFFDHHIPHGYKWEYIVLLESLKEVFFPKKQWLHRKMYSYKLSKAIEKSKQVLTLDTGTALELNERLNIPEDKISRIHGFFPQYSIDSNSPIQIDVKTKHNLKGEYLIYDSGNEVHNNFERILKTIKLLKDSWIFVYIIILCDSTNSDLDIRSKVIQYNITENILFLWNVPKSDEKSYYSQSLGVIFSSIYESFPFHFSKALAYNCPIFANEIPRNKDVMWESISYLDPLSIHNMRDKISHFIQNTITPDYSEILNNYSPLFSAKELSERIGIKN